MIAVIKETKKNKENARLAMVVYCGFPQPISRGT